MEPTRCEWVKMSNPLYVRYHDREWGLPIKTSQKLFEFLCLEGAQAGLSWETILKKREGYRKAFHRFNPKACAKMTDKYLESQLNNEAIVRNRLKVFSVRSNAIAFLAVAKEFGSFRTYIWSFVDDIPIQYHRKRMSDIPATTKESEAMSKDLKKRGFKFIGSTICYAFMQAAGLVNDHTTKCFRFSQVQS